MEKSWPDRTTPMFRQLHLLTQQQPPSRTGCRIRSKNPRFPSPPSPYGALFHKGREGARGTTGLTASSLLSPCGRGVCGEGNNNPLPWALATRLGRSTDGLLLQLQQPVDAVAGQVEKVVEPRSIERFTFGRSLNLDEQPTARLHHVEVDLGLAILSIFEIEPRLAIDDTGTDGRYRRAKRHSWELPRLHQPIQRETQGDVGAGNRGGAGTAVGPEHITIEQYRTFSELVELGHRPQRAADQPLDLVCAAGRERALAIDALG